MTRDEARDAAAVMLAYAEGETVQWSHRRQDWQGWHDLTGTVQFDFSQFRYRVKTEPREVWVCFYPQTAVLYRTESNARRCVGEDGELVRFIESID